MNLRDLKYVVAVADSSHFGHAAERCHVSQPTLSGQIKKLEDELGITLFERTKRSVAITPIGETIVAHAREILEQAETIRQIAQSHQDPLIGPLRIGAIMTLSPYLMPLILKPLRDQLPQMRLVISEEMTETLLERLRKHEIDAALIATPVDTGEFSTIPLFDEPFWLAHPRNHPFQEKKTITQKDLDNTELLLLAEGHCLADQAMEVCHMKARAQQGDMADLHAASLETLLQLVGVGFGCTLIPDLAVRGIRMNDKDIVTRRLHQKDAFRRVSLAFRRSFPRRQALDAFIEVVLDNLPDTVHRLS